METTKNTLIRAASIMMAICACVAVIISAFNIFITTGLVGNLSADQSAMIELESQLEGLLSADQAVGIFSAVMYAALILIVIFNVMKIIVGIVGFRKAETGTTYFIAWGIVLLVFGVLSLGGLFSLLGICNLLGGIVAPILFIIGGSQNKKRAVL